MVISSILQFVANRKKKAKKALKKIQSPLIALTSYSLAKAHADAQIKKGWKTLHHLNEDATLGYYNKKTKSFVPLEKAACRVKEDEKNLAKPEVNGHD